MKKTKTLYLVRHAKSCWSDPSLSDRARPLNSRGQRDLPLMADRLATNISQPDDHFLRPQAIITSPAVRAHATARGFAKMLQISTSTISVDERLYFQGTGAILDVIREQPDECDTLALVGHNPNLTHLYNTLCTVDIWSMPSCSIATLIFDLESWKELKESSGQIIDFDFPKKCMEF